VTEAFLTELGLNGETVRAIVEWLAERQAEKDRSAAAERSALEEGIAAERRLRLQLRLEQAGMRQGFSREALLSAMMTCEDEEALLQSAMAQSPELFCAERIPRFAGPLGEEEDKRGAGELPFHYVRSRKGEEGGA